VRPKVTYFCVFGTHGTHETNDDEMGGSAIGITSFQLPVEDQDTRLPDVTSSIISLRSSYSIFVWRFYAQRLTRDFENMTAMRVCMKAYLHYFIVLFISLLTSQAWASVSATRTQPKLDVQPWLKRVFAGGAGRALAQSTLYPIDALRTLAQTRDGRTLKDVGMSALVRGSATTSMFAFGMGSIQFGIFGACKARGIPALWASALGAAGSCIVSVPQEVIKQRLVTNVYPSFTVAIKSIAQKEGIRGFYAAWRPTMARNVPFVMITFTTMDFLQSFLLRQHPEKKSLSTTENVAIGVASAFVAGVLTNPADVIKTRLMTQAASTQVPYSSALDCLVTLVRTEGAGKLYAGFRQRSIYMCSLWGVTFALNSRFQKFMDVAAS